MSNSNTFLPCGCHLTASDGNGGCKMHAEIERLRAAFASGLLAIHCQRCGGSGEIRIGHHDMPDEIYDCPDCSEIWVALTGATDQPHAALEPCNPHDPDIFAEAARVLNRLNSDDPDFDDCAYAAALIHRFVDEHRGPDGFATWKDAAVAERLRRVKHERRMERSNSAGDAANDGVRERDDVAGRVAPDVTPDQRATPQPDAKHE